MSNLDQVIFTLYLDYGSDPRNTPQKQKDALVYTWDPFY